MDTNNTAIRALLSPTEPWLHEQLSIVFPELIALLVQDAPVKETLHTLIQAVARVRGPGTRAAIFIHDPTTRELRFAGATGMSPGYTAAVDGFPVEPCKPSCGSATYYGEDLFVYDVLVDERWQPFVELPKEFGFRACWSFVLKTSEDTCLGTLAIYHAEPSLPSEQDIKQIRYFANVAALLIERHMKLQKQREELHELEEAARQSRRTGTSLAIVAHELRNPLSAVASAVDVLRLGGAQQELRERAVQVIDKQIHQMEWLIEDLIDAERVTRNALSVSLKRHALGDILRFSVETMSPQFAAKRQDLRLEINIASDLAVNADSRRLAQVFNNLLSNAAKYSPEDTKVWLRATARPDEVEVSIEDQGIGIQKDDLPHVFQMFRRLDATEGEGLGIGLGLVKRVVELHGGRAQVHSAGPGAGSVFTVKLPLAPENAVSPAVELPGAHTVAPRPD
jgi:signal transduction histidine kinase